MSERHHFIVGFRNCGRKFLDSAIPVLEAQRAVTKVDLYEPVADEVVGGLFHAFQKYGIGQEKLYKMQLRKLLEEGTIADSPELREFIDSDSDEEIADEVVNVRLKNFKDLRKLATDAKMKDDYVLHYQPDSTVVHGHWPALRRYYLQMCHEPLHRLHLQPTFNLPPLNPELLDRAFRLFIDAYELWTKRYGLEDQLSPLVDQYFEGCNAVIAEQTSPE